MASPDVLTEDTQLLLLSVRAPNGEIVFCALAFSFKSSLVILKF